MKNSMYGEEYGNWEAKLTCNPLELQFRKKEEKVGLL